jgi:hypothetical protein
VFPMIMQGFCPHFFFCVLKTKFWFNLFFFFLKKKKKKKKKKARDRTFEEANGSPNSRPKKRTEIDEHRALFLTCEGETMPLIDFLEGKLTCYCTVTDSRDCLICITVEDLKHGLESALEVNRDEDKCLCCGSEWNGEQCVECQAGLERNGVRLSCKCGHVEMALQEWVATSLKVICRDCGFNDIRTAVEKLLKVRRLGCGFSASKKSEVGEDAASKKTTKVDLATSKIQDTNKALEAGPMSPEGTSVKMGNEKIAASKKRIQNDQTDATSKAIRSTEKAPKVVWTMNQEVAAPNEAAPVIFSRESSEDEALVIVSPHDEVVPLTNQEVAAPEEAAPVIISQESIIDMEKGMTPKESLLLVEAPSFGEKSRVRKDCESLCESHQSPIEESHSASHVGKPIGGTKRRSGISESGLHPKEKEEMYEDEDCEEVNGKNDDDEEPARIEEDEIRELMEEDGGIEVSEWQNPANRSEETALAGKEGLLVDFVTCAENEIPVEAFLAGKSFCQNGKDCKDCLSVERLKNGIRNSLTATRNYGSCLYCRSEVDEFDGECSKCLGLKSDSNGIRCKCKCGAETRMISDCIAFGWKLNCIQCGVVDARQAIETLVELLDVQLPSKGKKEEKESKKGEELEENDDMESVLSATPRTRYPVRSSRVHVQDGQIGRIYESMAKDAAKERKSLSNFELEPLARAGSVMFADQSDPEHPKLALIRDHVEANFKTLKKGENGTIWVPLANICGWERVKVANEVEKLGVCEKDKGTKQFGKKRLRHHCVILRKIGLDLNGREIGNQEEHQDDQKEEEDDDDDEEKGRAETAVPVSEENSDNSF